MQTQDTLKNIFAAFTLSIISLSMGAAFGIMSGRGAFAGMVSAGVLAVVAALLGGTKVQCSGPTAPVTALLVSVVATQQDLSFTGMEPDQFLNLVFVLAGLLLFVSGALRLGRYVALIPNVVVSGFMTGIGLLIFSSQITELLSVADLPHFGLHAGFAVGAFAVCFAAPYALKRWIPTWAGLLSGTFLVLLLGTGLAQALQLPLTRVDLNVAGGTLLSALPVLQVSAVQLVTWSGVGLALFWAAQLALTIYLDTLMTSVIMDRISGNATNRKRELMAQGFGSFLVGLIGGMPGAQATVRSVLFLKEGATKRWAGVLMGVFCFVFVVLFRGWLEMIPNALFLGILLKVAFDIIDFQPLRLYVRELRNDHVWQHFFSRHDDAPIFVTNREMLFIVSTAALTVLVGLIPAVLVCTSVSLALNATLWATNPMRDLTPSVESTAPYEQV